MENNHHPGPWFISPQGKYIRAEGIHGWNIAEIIDQPPYTEGNAELIYLAPQLKTDNEKLKILLHDLTPGGSEFVNDPEYCAKWIKDDRENTISLLKNAIIKLKADNEAIREANRELISHLEYIERIIDNGGGNGSSIFDRKGAFHVKTKEVIQKHFKP